MSSLGGFGAYGAYVWSAVGLFVAVTLVNAWAARAAYLGARERARRALGLAPEQHQP
jgi:heme exporter protein D